MGKNFTGENSKAAAAKERKSAAANDKKQKEVEEKEKKLAEEWAVGTKKNKKEDDEAKRAEKLAKKGEKEALQAAEDAEIAKIKPAKTARGAEKSAVKREVAVEASQSNIPTDIYAARSIDDALELLSLTSGGNEGGSASSSKEGLERHPERRMKAAYTQYEERELPLLKKEYPTLRFTQLKEILWKEWQKSPENPMNQQHADYNVNSDEAKRMLGEQREARLESMRVSSAD